MSSATVPAFQHRKTLKVHSDNVNTIVFSTDGKFLATGGDDGLICIVNMQSLEVVRKFKAVSPVRAIVWHPDSSNVIIAGLKNGVVNTIQLKVRYSLTLENTFESLSCSQGSSGNTQLADQFTV
jgi:WD40 repeat protein